MGYEKKRYVQNSVFWNVGIEGNREKNEEVLIRVPVSFNRNVYNSKGIKHNLKGDEEEKWGTGKGILTTVVQCTKDMWKRIQGRGRRWRNWQYIMTFTICIKHDNWN